MTAPRMFRSLALATAAVCVCLLALPGCGGSPTSAPAKKEEPKAPPPGPVDPNKPDPNKTNPITPQPAQPALGPVEKAADDAIVAFSRGLGSPKADVLTTRLRKIVGKPVGVFDSDKMAGYSATAAEGWLQRVGGARSFSAEGERQQAGDTVYVRGDLQGNARYSLRLVKEGGAWKVDAVVFSAAKGPEKLTATTADAALQEFAVTAFVEALGAGNVVAAQADHAAMVAGLVTAEARAEWAAPFDGDKKDGRDFSPAKLAVKAAEFAGGTASFTVARAGGTDAQPEYRVVLTRPAGPRTLMIRLVKQDNVWLVAGVTVQPG